MQDKPLSELTGSKLTVESLLFDADDDGSSKTSKKKKKKQKIKDLKLKDSSKIEGDLEKIYRKTVEKSKDKLSLTAPLSTPQAQKAARSAIYKKVSKDVGQWDAVIHSRRAAEVVTFPLEKPDLKLKTIADHCDATFTPRTPLEAEVMAALHGGKSKEEAGPQKIQAGELEHFLLHYWQQHRSVSITGPNEFSSELGFSVRNHRKLTDKSFFFKKELFKYGTDLPNILMRQPIQYSTHIYLMRKFHSKIFI